MSLSRLKSVDNTNFCIWFSVIWLFGDVFRFQNKGLRYVVNIMAWDRLPGTNTIKRFLCQLKHI